MINVFFLGFSNSQPWIHMLSMHVRTSEFFLAFLLLLKFDLVAEVLGLFLSVCDRIFSPRPFSTILAPKLVKVGAATLFGELF